MTQAQPASKTKAKPKSAPPGAQDAIALLEEDHVKVKKLFKDFEKLKEGDGSSDAKAALVEQICQELTVHAQIEEAIFYPAVRVRSEPKLPFAKQHLKAPSFESALTPRPRYQALQYQAADKLKGKVALITGGDSGIGRAVAVPFAREGANVAISFLPQEYSDGQETQRAVALMIERGIRVNAVAPGPVWTPLNPSDPGLTPAKVAEFGKANPMGRPAQPEEVAPAYVSP